MTTPDEVLQGLGYTPEEVQKLRDAGILGKRPV